MSAPEKLSVKQPNVLTNGRYSYTKIEKNVMYHAIIALQGVMNSSGAVSESLLAENHLNVHIPYNVLKRWDKNNNLSRDLKTAVRSLRKKDYDIKTDNGGWVDSGFVTYAKYSERDGLELEISKALIPALVNVSKNFTAYDAVVAMSLQSKYAQRFYEWCCRWRDTGWFEFTPADLNDILLSNYTTGQLNERVITPAQAELDDLFNKSLADVCFTVETERGGVGRGGGVKKWRFHVKTRQTATKGLPITNEDYLYVLDYLKKAWPGNIQLINKAGGILATSKSVKLIAERFELIKLREIDNLGAYVRTILRDEFNIPL